MSRNSADPVRVRLVDPDGWTVYNQLLIIDGNTRVLRFSEGESLAPTPYGFVLPAEHPGHTIEPGWLTLAEFNEQRRRRWPDYYKRCAP